MLQVFTYFYLQFSLATSSIKCPQWNDGTFKSLPERNLLRDKWGAWELRDSGCSSLTVNLTQLFDKLLYFLREHVLFHNFRRRRSISSHASCMLRYQSYSKVFYFSNRYLRSEAWPWMEKYKSLIISRFDILRELFSFYWSHISFLPLISSMNDPTLSQIPNNLIILPKTSMDTVL